MKAPTSAQPGFQLSAISRDKSPVPQQKNWFNKMANPVAAPEKTMPPPTLQNMKNVALGSMAAIAIATTMPNAANASDLKNGEKLFNANCAACHTQTKGINLLEPDKPLFASEIKANLPGGLSEQSIVDLIRVGKGKAPAFGGKLTEKELHDVAGYVYDMAANNKWDPVD